LFWSRDQDSTGTGNLFQAPEVSEIRIDLLYGLPEPANEVGMPAGAVKVRILQTDLQVDVDLMTLLVTDQQDMFFRRGFAEAGEDTTHWFLFEWRDLPTLARPGLESFGSSAAPTPTVASLTWWKLKTLFGAK